jgi:hypothetical protein
VPKYTPTEDDLYSTKPCFICGQDVVFEGSETCSDLCEQQKRIFDEDLMLDLLRDMEDDLW